jgi:DNA-binding SARP family transcriptional activator/DNA-binding beta-propeller fold protein YncE
MQVTITLLGQVEATVDGRAVDLGAPQQRALLALLALRRGTIVTLEAIVNVLWLDDPPATAVKVVQTYVSRLRKALGADAITYRGGYALAADVSVDLDRFRELVASGQPAAALALWRGRAVADVPLLGDESERLEELRLGAIEDRIDADLVAGEAATLVPELQALVAERPARERLIGQLMLALYRSGRQVDALAVYRDARRVLADELGLEPGAALKELERRILQQDPSLTPRAEEAPRRPRRRHRVLVLPLVAALVAAAVGVALGRGAHHAAIVIRANTLIRIDPKTNAVLQSFPIGRNPGAVTATGGAVWVASERDRTISRIDLQTNHVDTIGDVNAAAFLTHDARGNIYASGWDYPQVLQIDPFRVEIVRTWRVRSRALGLAVGGGSLWVVDRLVNSVTRIDLARHRVAETIPVGADPLVDVFGFGAVWVGNSDDASVSVLRPGVSRPARIGGLSKVFGIAAGEGAVWVGSYDDSAVYRVDPDTRRVVARISVKKTFRSGLFDVTAGAGFVCAVNRDQGDIAKIDPRTNRVVAHIPFPPGTEPRSIAIAGDQVWITVANPADDN